MRKWMKTILAVACMAALLAGCGTKAPEEPQQPAEEPAPETPAEETKPDITLEQVMEANRIENLLKNHSAVRVETSLYEQEGDETPVSTIKSQYTMEDGYLQVYRVFSDRDGAAVLTVKTTYLDGPEFYTMTYYFVNPDTYELYAVDAYTYGTEENDSMGAEKKAYIYDEAREQEVSPFQAIIADKDYCELNVIVDYMGENQTVYWYPVAHDTQVSFQTGREDYSLYNDEEMTGALGKYDDIDISRDVANLFVVYGK